VVTADDAAEVDEQDIAALMGFGGFGTTQVRQELRRVLFFVEYSTLITPSCRERRTKTTSPRSASGRNGTIAK
jgi:hypothetical protein